MTPEKLPFDGDTTPYIGSAANDDQYIVGQFARITHMANAEDQWLVGRVGRIAGQSVINDEIASVLIAIDDTDEFVNAGDFALLTSGDVQAYIDGLIEANTDALGTLGELKMLLGSILRTINRTPRNETEQNHALGWIKHAAVKALEKVKDYAPEVTTKTEPTA